MSVWRLLPLVTLGALLIGCGQNKFQREVETEQTAVKLARETVAGQYDLVTVAELKKLLDDKTELILIDAMPYESSFAKEHIPGARQFLFSKDQVMEQWDSSETASKSQEDYERLLGEDKQRLVVVYCGFVKCMRSHNAAIWAQRSGYTNVKRFTGGIYAWKGAGYPTESSP